MPIEIPAEPLDLRNPLKERGGYVHIPSDEGAESYVWHTLEEIDYLVFDGIRAAFNEVIADKIGKERLRHEVNLFRSKWFDYRFLHPAQATQQFAIQYCRVFKQHFAATFGKNEAALKEGLSAWVVAEMSSRELSSLWRARQYADAAGATYEFYIKHAMEHLSAQGWKRVPRPNQLIRKDLVVLIRRKWMEHTKAILTHSTADQYQAEQFRGEPAQFAHHEWLINEIRRRGATPSLIALFCRQERLLPNDLAVKKFGEEKVRRSESEMIYSEPAPVAKLEDKDFRPGCFGIQHVYQAAGAACSACPYRFECVDASDLAARLIKRTFGHEDPAQERKRANARQRQRQCRARRRASIKIPTQ